MPSKKAKNTVEPQTDLADQSRAATARKSPVPAGQQTLGRISLREEQRLLTRDRLLDAALIVFKRVGYRAATVDMITQEAGTNRATFYLHFRSQVDVAAGLGRRLSGEYAHMFFELDKLDIPRVKDVTAWLDTILNSRRGDSMLGRMLQEAIAADTEFAQEAMDYMVRIADRMTNYLAHFRGKQKQNARSRLLLVQMLINRYLAYLDMGVPFAGESGQQVMAQMIWNMLYAELQATAQTPT